jgi:hypothetical protein
MKEEDNDYRLKFVNRMSSQLSLHEVVRRMMRRKNPPYLQPAAPPRGARYSAE